MNATSSIGTIAFEVLSEEMILAMSIGEVISASLEEKGAMKIGGTLDPRSGTMERGALCRTCNQDYLGCQGHAMHINLPIPIINVNFLANLMKIVRSLCPWCSNLKGGTDSFTPGVTGKVQFAQIVSSRSSRQSCAFCLHPFPRLKVRGVLVYATFDAKHISLLRNLKENHEENKEEDGEDDGGVNSPPFASDILSLLDLDNDKIKQRVHLSTFLLRKILHNVSISDYSKMGIQASTSHPVNMIMRVLLVPPPLTRPNHQYSESSRHRSPHDFTMWIQEICRAKARLLKITQTSELSEVSMAPTGIRQATKHARNVRNKKSPEQLIQGVYEELCGAVCGFINSDSPAAKIHATITMKSALSTRNSLTSVQKGKCGQWRMNIFGKRVDYSARTVACPGSQNVRADQVTFPGMFGEVLTYQTTVRSYNEEALRQRIRLGVVGGVKGATTVTFGTGQSVSTAGMSEDKLELLASSLSHGCKVRHALMEGEPVWVNRQPSLRRGSMMAHKIIHCPKEMVQRVNTAVVGASNLDFDGDQINNFVPQKEHGRAETAELMTVDRQIISAQSHKPIIGLIQDCVVGCYRLTAPGVFVALEDAMMAAAQATCSGPIDRLTARGDSGNEGDLTGHELFSLLLPLDFSYQGTHGNVVIKSGHLVQGRLCKKILGSSSTGLLHALVRIKGPEVAIQYLSDAQLVVGHWLSQNLITMGMRDCIAPRQTDQETYRAYIQGTVSDANLRLSNGADQEKVMEVVSKKLHDLVTQTANQVLQNAIEGAASGGASNFLDIVQSGAKGTVVNLAQVHCLVGMQELAWNRKENALWRRSLSCFPAPDRSRRLPNSVQAQGFVCSSFSGGLTPPDMFFHLSSSWDALMSTSIRTSQSGYAHRKMSKASEDVVVEYDGSVRHQATRRIVQYCYGTDGCDGACLDPVNIPELAKMTELTMSNLSEDAIRAVRRCQMEGTCLLSAHERENSGEDPRVTSTLCYLPFNLSQRLLQLRLCNDDLSGMGVMSSGKRELMRRRGHALLREFCSFLHKEETEKTHSTALLQCHTLCALSDMDMLVDRCEGVLEMEDFFENLKDLYYRAMIQAGEAVGLLSTESQCEPLTQLVLDVFHQAGVQQLATSQGIPRFNELIDGSSNTKLSGMHLVIKTEACQKGPGYLEKLVVEIPSGLMHRIIRRSFVLADSEPWDRVPKVLATLVKLQLSARRLMEGPEPPHWSPFFVLFHLKPPYSNVSLAIEGIIRHLGSTTAFRVEPSSLIMPECFITVRMTACDPPPDPVARTSLKMLEVCTDLLRTHILRSVKIGTLRGVTSAQLSRNKTSIVTLGSNLKEAWLHPDVDWARSTSNDIRMIERLLGIEAATCVLFHEIRAVLMSGGNYVADRHISLTASIMTNTGQIRPLTRHGSDRLGRVSAVISSSFEQQNAHLSDAAMFSESSEIRGLSDSVVVGRVPRVGTGIVTLVDLPAARIPPEQKWQDADLTEGGSVDRDLVVTTCFPRDDPASVQKQKDYLARGLSLTSTSHLWKQAFTPPKKDSDAQTPGVESVDAKGSGFEQRLKELIAATKELVNERDCAPPTSRPVFRPSSPKVARKEQPDIQSQLIYDARGNFVLENFCDMMRTVI